MDTPIPPAGAEPGQGFDIEDPFMADVSMPSKTTQPNPLITPPQLDESIMSQEPVFKQPEAPLHRSRKGMIIGIVMFVALLMIVAIFFIVSRIISLQDASQGVVATPTPNTLLESPIVSLAPLESTIVSSAPDMGTGADDPDADGITNAEEHLYGTDANKSDTDGDTFPDGEEVKNGYNPLGTGKLDSDNDGFPDPDERKFGTDPFNPDTDGDGYSDGDEIANGHNPLIPAPGDTL